MRKRGTNRWEISIELPRDPKTGKRRRHWETVHGTKRQAAARLAELAQHLLHGGGAPTSMTVKEWLEEWLRQHQAEVRATTFERTERIVKNALIPAFGHFRLSQLKPASISRTYARWREEGVKPSTVRTRHQVLARALRDAVRLELLPYAPTDRVRQPRAERRVPRIEPETMRKIVDSLSSLPPMIRAFFTLIAYTGLRRGEAAGLQWSDVDLEGRTITIRRNLTATPSRAVVIHEPKTKAGTRVVPLAEPAAEALREWRRVQLEMRLAAGPEWKGDDWVFTEADGLKSPETFTMSWVRHARKIGVDLRLHDLRHGAATLMAAAGVPPRVIADLLGHAKPSFTLDVYASAPDLEAKRRGIESLARVLEQRS